MSAFIAVNCRYKLLG